MTVDTKICIIGVLMLVAMFLGGYFVEQASAASCHYELDKPYYHPGDSGYFLAEVSNNQPASVDITDASLNITGVGSFFWNASTVNSSDLNHASIVEMPHFDASGNSYAPTNGCRIEVGGSAALRVYFKIPEETQRGDYRYQFYMPIMMDVPVEINGIINVYSQGETPQPGPFSGLFLVGLLLTFVLSPVYLILRWRKMRAAKYAKIGVILAIVLLLLALLLSFLIP